MKKTFLTRRNALLAPENISWGGGALIVVLILLLVRLVAPNGFFFLLSPVMGGAQTLADTSHLLFSSFGDRATLAFQNEQLQNDNTILSLTNTALLDKAARLQALLDASTADRSHPAQMLAEVVAHPPESPYDTLLLAAGSEAGVVLGDGVFTASRDASSTGLIPIGLVTMVTPSFSRVTLFSSPGVHTSAWIGSTHVPLTLVGVGAGAVESTAPRAAAISVGDVVMSTGVGTLALGRVVRIDSDPSSPAVVLRIVPAVNPFSIPEVILRDVGTTFLSSFTIGSSTLL